MTGAYQDKISFYMAKQLMNLFCRSLAAFWQPHGNYSDNITISNVRHFK